MIKKITLRSLILTLTVWASTVYTANAQSFTENFDDITTLPGSGWALTNNSSPLGTTNWFQGNNAVFNSFNGATTAYIGANFNNTGNVGDISNWLISPNRTLRNGDVITFYTSTVGSPAFPDRLELRLSTNGASTNVGATSASVGDFGTLLVSVNPNLTTAGYPNTWTQYTATLSGIPGGAVSGRFAFRYFVTNGGASGTNSDYIGIDNVVYSAFPCPVITVLPSTLPDGNVGVAYNQVATQTGGNAPVTFSVGSTVLPYGVSMATDGTFSGSPTTTGPFNFTVTASDFNGCTGSQDYSIAINCSPVAVDLGGPYEQCGGSVTLDPGTAVSYIWNDGTTTTQTQSASSTGTYSVTITDANGCTGSASADVTINPLPVVDLGGPFAQCGGSVNLDAGNAGGTYIWNDGITTTQTQSASSTGTYSVTVTDANTCTGSAQATVTINGAPVVDLGGPYNQCGGTVTLDAGNAGSTYIWDDGITTTQTQTVSSTGTYSVTVTDANTCTGSAQVNVNINSNPVVDLGGPYQQCGGTVTLDATDFFISYNWSDGSNGQTLTTDTSGTFSVTVSDEVGCTGTGSAVVEIDTFPVVNLGGPYVQCAGVVTLDAGYPGSTYIWSDGTTTTVTFGATVTGTYSVTVTDIHTCTGSASADVTIYQPPLNHTGYVICQGLSVPAGAGLTATGCGTVSTSFDGTTSLQDPTFNRSETGASFNPSPIGTAVHYTTHTFEVGTTGSYTFAMCGNYDTYLHIYKNALNTTFPATGFLVADDDSNQVVCGGGSKTTITLTAGITYIYVATGFSNSDVGDYTVTFTGPGPVYEGPLTEPLWFSSPVGGPLVFTGQLFNPVGTTGLPNTNTPGTYTYYSACPATPDCRTPISFVIHPTPVVNLGGPYNQCGGSVALNAGAGNTSYSWSDLSSAQTTTATTSGTYTVTVSNSFNCSATGTTEVYIQSVPVVNLGLDHTQCGGTVTLDAGNPGNQFHWSDQSNGQTLTVGSTGIYSVTVGDINTNCTAADDVSVTINPVPEVDLGSDVVQCGGIVTLNADNPGATYLWSDNSTNQTLVVSASGIYRVTVTNAFGCTATSSINITINSYPTLGADKTDSVCVGYNVDLNTFYANTYATYVWDTPNPSAVGAGVYNLIVTNAAGCADTATVTIINRQQPNLGADLVDSICIGYTYDLWTLYPPSASYTTYVWNTPTPSAVIAGNYSLIVTNASGCSDTLNAVITYRQQPNLGADKADSVCVGYTLDLTTYYPNTGYATYVWNTPTPTAVGAGTYTLIVSYASGCSDTAVVTITYRQQPVVTLNMPLAMCYTDPEFALTGGMPAGGTYVVGDSLNVDTFNAVTFGIGVHHITYIYTNASGCTDSASIDFTVHPQPHVTTVAPPDLCTGSAPMNLNNYFSPLGGVFTGFGVSQHYFYPALTGQSNDTIIYYYTDQFGCKDTSVYPLKVKNSVHVSLVSSDVDFTICSRDSITFTASGAEFYQFFVNGVAVDTASPSNTFTTNSLSNHSDVYVVGSNSCSTDTSESIVIDVITLPTVDAGPDTTIALGQIVHLHTKSTGTGSLVFDWAPNYHLDFANVPNPTYSGPDTVTFVVKVTDTYGCWGTDTITINVYVPDNVLLPNILTPDGDGKNDKWILNYKINLDGSNLIIFNRWGETVYEANSYTNDWDGTYKATGKKLPDDTYYYVLKVPAQNNHIYKGAINILNGTAK